MTVIFAIIIALLLEAFMLLTGTEKSGLPACGEFALTYTYLEASMRSQLLKIGRRVTKGVAAAAALCVATSFAQAADTVQDFTVVTFDTGSTPSRISLHQFASAPAPGLQPVDPEGWDGGYMRITTAVNDQQNTIGFNQVYSGSYDALNVGFDFSINNGPGGADGLSLGYMNSSG